MKMLMKNLERVLHCQDILPEHVGGQITVSLFFLSLCFRIASSLDCFSSIECIGSGTTCFSSSSISWRFRRGLVIRDS